MRPLIFLLLLKFRYSSSAVHKAGRSWAAYLCLIKMSLNNNNCNFSARE